MSDEVARLAQALVQQIANERERGQGGRPNSAPINLRPKDVATRWNCSARTVRNMINDGRLPAFRAGGKLLRVPLEEVEKIEAQDVCRLPRRDEAAPDPSRPSPRERLALQLLREQERR